MFLRTILKTSLYKQTLRHESNFLLSNIRSSGDFSSLIRSLNLLVCFFISRQIHSVIKILSFQNYTFQTFLPKKFCTHVHFKNVEGNKKNSFFEDRNLKISKIPSYYHSLTPQLVVIDHLLHAGNCFSHRGTVVNNVFIIYSLKRVKNGIQNTTGFGNKIVVKTAQPREYAKTRELYT